MMEIRDLVALARENPTEASVHDLWQAVFRLQAWYFLPVEDVEGPSNPAMTEVDGAPWLIAFSNFRRLRDFSRLIGRIAAEDSEMNMLILNPLQSMTRFRTESEIAGVIFNPQSDETFRATREAFLAYADYFGIHEE